MKRKDDLGEILALALNRSVVLLEIAIALASVDNQHATWR